MTFRKSESHLIKKSSKKGVEFTIAHHKYEGKELCYLFHQNKDLQKPLIMIIHGAPGSSSGYLDYIENHSLRNQYSILIVDRLGYGHSEYGKVASIENQSKIIIDLISTLKQENQNVYIMGHSYGGTIAGTIATYNPTFLTATIMLAPALDPKQEKYFWYSRLGKWKATRALGSGALKVAADEKYSHAEQLATYLNKWALISKPIYHIHGDADKVVPFGNIQFSKEHINKNVLHTYEWKGMNHFFPFSDKEQLIILIDKYIESIEGRLTNVTNELKISEYIR
jgi:uncharacterized protein